MTNVFLLPVGRAGVPMEVMGLMLGEFVDDYTVRVIDVFAMPQSGTVSCRPLSNMYAGRNNLLTPFVFLLLIPPIVIFFLIPFLCAFQCLFQDVQSRLYTIYVIALI